MTSLEGVPSELTGYIRVLLVWSSIQRTSESVMLRIRGYNKQKNMSSQRTLSEYIKVWRMMNL